MLGFIGHTEICNCRKRRENPHFLDKRARRIVIALMGMTPH